MTQPVELAVHVVPSSSWILGCEWPAEPPQSGMPKARLRQLRRAAGRQIWLSADAARQVLRRVSLMGPRVAVTEAMR